MARRDARRAEALAHNEASAAKSLELEAAARAARARMVERRQAMTAGMAPMESGPSMPPAKPKLSKSASSK